MKWIRIGLLVLVLSGLLLLPQVVLAESSSDITITATGYVAGAPGGLTLTYVSDYEIGVSWTKGEDAVNTMVRIAYGRLPSSRTDGLELYNGTGTSATHWIGNVGLVGPVYYRAWSQNAGGVWEESGVSEEGNFMSASFLFIGFIALALALTLIALKVRLILFRMAAALGWLVLGVWLLLSDSTNLQMSDTWTQILGFLFLIMVVGVLSLQMITETKRELVDKSRPGFPGAGTSSWTEWGLKPKEEVESRSTRVKRERKEKLRAIRTRHGR